MSRAPLKRVRSRDSVTLKELYCVLSARYLMNCNKLLWVEVKKAEEVQRLKLAAEFEATQSSNNPDERLAQ
eukprot:gene35437-43692_t